MKKLLLALLCLLSLGAGASNLPAATYLNGGMTQLLTIQGDSTNMQSVFWYSPNPPQQSADRYVYLWDNNSTATPTGDGVVQPTAVTGAGRWLRQGPFYNPWPNPDWNVAGSAEAILNKPSIPAPQVNTDWNASAGVAQLLNKPVIPAAQVNADWSATSGIAQVLNKPVRSQAAQSRGLNAAFQISSTRDAYVFYSVQITITASITGAQNGDVVMEIASDSGFTANVQTLSIAGLGQTYTLAVALQGVQPASGIVCGYVPAGYYTRLRTVNNAGTPTFAYRAGQEVLL